MPRQKKDPVLVEQVANGFIVSPKEQTGLSTLTDIHVFESVEKLSEFLSEYFGPEKER